jgi:hypothetical protein
MAAVSERGASIKEVGIVGGGGGARAGGLSWTRG